MTDYIPGPAEGPQPGSFGFGFGPDVRRAIHRHHRAARRDMRNAVRDHIRAEASAPGGGFGFGPFGQGFGPGGQAGFPFNLGPGGSRGRHRGRGRRRGDVRAAILALLRERPMHGYEMIQEIGERSNGLWRPSPGSVYPTLQLLEDEGLIAAVAAEGTKRLFELTAEGRETATAIATPPWEEIAEDVDPNHVNLRSAFGQLAAALFQAGHAASPEQQKRIVDVVNGARREIYGILGEAE